MRIYAASSWRNQRLTAVVEALRAAGHEVYDFREDDDQGAAFNWSDIDPNWQKWSPGQFREALGHPLAKRGYGRDIDSLMTSEALLLVMPCGRSAHLELGIAIGMQKPTAVLLSDGEPELMYKAAKHICLDVEEVLRVFKDEEFSRVQTFKLIPGEITKMRKGGE